MKKLILLLISIPFFISICFVCQLGEPTKINRNSKTTFDSNIDTPETAGKGPIERVGR